MSGKVFQNGSLLFRQKNSHPGKWRHHEYNAARFIETFLGKAAIYLQARVDTSREQYFGQGNKTSLQQHIGGRPGVFSLPLFCSFIG
ncbi:unnamed protein product [Larinioides sclopetarius]|uniref:Uncharacterized protein n=1 Tax=Larinioides sclopetarius TaxID=280406 RepID=A0AAV2BDW5_9ARAC